MNANAITVDRLLAAYRKRGYAVFGGTQMQPRPYDLNFFGIRADTGLRVSDRFDDILGCFYRDEAGLWRLKKWAGTTDPGAAAFLRPMNPDGTGVLVPGQYRGMWKIGKHKGLYDAFVREGAARLASVLREGDAGALRAEAAQLLETP